MKKLELSLGTLRCGEATQPWRKQHDDVFVVVVATSGHEADGDVIAQRYPVYRSKRMLMKNDDQKPLDATLSFVIADPRDAFSFVLALYEVDLRQDAWKHYADSNAELYETKSFKWSHVAEAGAALATRDLKKILSMAARGAWVLAADDLIDLNYYTFGPEELRTDNLGEVKLRGRVGPWIGRYYVNPVKLVVS